VLALQGAQARVAAEAKVLITAAYLAGMLTHCDPNKAPKLEDILGEEPAAKRASEPSSPSEARANARAWMAFLNGMAPKPRKRKTADD
jgi:hypothetical protein